MDAAIARVQWIVPYSSLPSRVRDRVETSAHSSIDLVYDGLLGETLLRIPQGRRPLVHLSDGQDALWQARNDSLPNDNAVDILDLLHVTPRL